MTATLDVETTSIEDLDDLEDRELQEAGSTLPGALADLVAFLAQSYARTPLFA
jgi:hypothetical protein